MPDREVTAPADAGDGPPVAVLNPVGGGESESPVVAAGDDHIPDTGLVAVSQPHHRTRHIPVEALITGATVEFGDQLARGGEHDGIESSRSVQDPSGEGILSGFGNVTDMDASVIEIEVERREFTFAEGE